jgi:ATP-dependent Clp protease protease subunit
LTVETVDNHVYFYAEVTPDRTLALMQTLRALDGKLRTEKISRGLADDVILPIWLHINSVGGDPFSAFAVYDQINKLHTPVYSIVEGRVASAATIISVGCPRRYCQPSAFMLIHSATSISWGEFTHTELADEAKFLEALVNQMVAHYAEHSKLDEETVRNYISRDCWMTAQQILEYGFADAYL